MGDTGVVVDATDGRRSGPTRSARCCPTPPRRPRSEPPGRPDRARSPGSDAPSRWPPSTARSSVDASGGRSRRSGSISPGSCPVWSEAARRRRSRRSAARRRIRTDRTRQASNSCCSAAGRTRSTRTPTSSSASRSERWISPVSASRRRILAENTTLGRMAAGSDLDLMHHAGGVVPVRRRVRATLTVHDIQPLDLPGNFSMFKRTYLANDDRPFDAVRRTGHRALRVREGPARSTASASMPICVRWCPGRAGADPSGRPRRDRDRSSPAPGLPARFLLYPAITYAHKNHAVLLDAFARVDHGTGVDAGADRRRPGHSRPTSGSASAAPTWPGASTCSAASPDDDLDALLPAATVGGGAVALRGLRSAGLEAMAAGCPAVVADAGIAARGRRRRRAGRRPGRRRRVGGCATVCRVGAGDPRPSRRSRSEAAASFSPDRTAAGYLDRPCSVPALDRHRATPRNLTREPSRHLPPLRPRRRPHRRGDDVDRAPSSRSAGTASTSSRRCPGTGTTASTRGGSIVSSRPRRPSGARSPGSTRSPPTSPTSRPAPWPSAGSPALATARRASGARFRPDVVLVMSPPLILGIAGWLAARRWRVPIVFNIQDVFPDVAIEVGAITEPAGDRASLVGWSGSCTCGPTRSRC